MSKHVLIVDDSKVSRMMIRAFMSEKRPDWTFDEASTGDEAVQKCHESQYDLITMDVNMPGISGLEAADRIRVVLPKAFITILTANIQQSVQSRASMLGVSFVQKPINADCIDRILSLAGA